MTDEGRIDKTSYEAAKTYFKAALEHMIATGRGVREFIEFSSEKFGDNIVPYLRRFLGEVREGRVKIKGLTAAAKSAVLGHPITPEERERLIREVAYLRAERRGFTGGSAQEDWWAAEREVDARLEREIGLVQKGRKALSSVTATVEREIDSVKQVVTRWVEGRGGAMPETGQVPAKKVKVAKKPAVAKKKVAAKGKAKPKETGEAKAPPKKKAVRKKAAKKKASAKKAAKKKSARTSGTP